MGLASVIKWLDNWDLCEACNEEVASCVERDRAVQEAGQRGIVGEGLRKRCSHVFTEVIQCTPTSNGLN